MTVAQQNTREGRIQPALVPVVNIKGPDDDDDGLGDLISGHAAQKHETRRKMKVVHGSENKIETLLRFYLKVHPYMNIFHGFDEIPPIVLAPQEINSLLQAIILSKPMDKPNEVALGLTYINYKLSIFINELITTSYNAGYDKFALDFSLLGLPLYYFGSQITATDSRPIYIQITGDIGADFGYKAKHAFFNINGNVNSSTCGIDAEYCSFTISGDVCGIHLAGYTLGYSGKECCFKTPNKRTLKTFIDYIPCDVYDHKIYFIHPNGREELVRKDKNGNSI